MNYDKMFQAGTAAQLEQMIKNEHKVGWDNFPLVDASDAIDHHLKNMCVEIWNDNDLREIKRMAANIANYVHMIILKCNKGLSDEKN